MSDMLPQLKHAKPLARAVLKGLRTLFTDYLQLTPDVSTQYVLAAVRHPFFKMR